MTSSCTDSTESGCSVASSASASGRRAAPITRSPAATAASASARPKPLLAPVISQIRSVVIEPVCEVDVTGPRRAGYGPVSRRRARSDRNFAGSAIRCLRAGPKSLHLADPRECPLRRPAADAQTAGLAAGHGDRARSGAPRRTCSGPFVVVSNHTSHLDAPLIIGALPRRLARYVAAGAAADYFFDVWWRRGPDRAVLQRLPGRPDRSAGQARHGHQPARRRRTAAAVPRGHPLADRGDGLLQARRRGAVHQPRRALRTGRHRRRRRPPCRAARTGRERGRPPVYLAFGEPMRPDDGENAAAFSDRIAKEVTRPDRLRDGLPRAAAERPATTATEPIRPTRSNPADPNSRTDREATRRTSPT